MQLRCAMRFFLFSMMAGLIFGCSNPMSDADLVGVYYADYKEAKEKLTLDKDHRFIQEVTLKAKGGTDIAKGSWNYDSSNGYITFGDGFMLVLDGFRNLDPNFARPKPGLVSQPVSRLFGEVTIGTNEGIIYTKR